MTKMLGKTTLKAAAIGAALMTSTSAFAQWQGTWDTTYGDVKLQESGKYVYGDYGSWGTIEGLKSDDGKTMRGVYRRNDDGTSGYFEWRINGTATFNGRWVKPDQTLPKWNSGGSRWNGNRKSTASPRLVVYRGGGNIGAFMGAQQAKYQRWAGSLYSSSGTSSTTAAAPKKAVNPLAKRFPKLADYPSDFTPKWFEVSVNTIKGQQRDTLVYGIMGIYAYCETSSASRPLNSFGNLKARIFDQTRKNPAKGLFNSPIYLGQNAMRRFPLDQNCLNDPQARIKVQFQTNLKEKDIASRDEVYGYRSFHFYLDQLPSSDDETGYLNLGVRRTIALHAKAGANTPITFSLYGGANLSTDYLTVVNSLRFTQ